MKLLRKALLDGSFLLDIDADDVDLNIVRLLAKVNTITAYAYKKSIGQHMPAFNCVPTTRLPSGSKRN